MRPVIPERVVAAAGDRRSGATEIAVTAAEGLLEVAGDPESLAAAVGVLLAGQPVMAPVWHLARAAGAAEPAPALRAVLDAVRHDTGAAVRAARSWLDREVGAAAVETVSHSSLVVRVLAGRPVAERPAAGVAGVIGADAIGPDALLNADGSAALAARLPTLVVATAVKLVPAGVFERLRAPGFERVPLAAVAAVVLGGEVVEPAEAGRRAAALAARG